MNIGHIFASAVIRKLAYLLVAAVVGWLSMGHARAADYPGFASCTAATRSDAMCPDRAVAYTEARASAQFMCDADYWPCGEVVEQFLEAPSGYYFRYRLNVNGVLQNPENGYIRSYGFNCTEPAVWNPATFKCDLPKVCDPNAAPLAGGFMQYTGTEPGYQTCKAGCEYNPSSMTYKTGTVDGIQYVSTAGWIPNGASCTVGPSDEYTPPADSDRDGVSDANDTKPTNPGESTEPEGPDKPTGKTNADKDGSGNNNKSSGGGSCDSPPSSSGDEIGAQIAYQSWSTRCAIERAKDGSGNLKTVAGTVTGGTGGVGGGTGTDPNTSILTAIKEAVTKTKEFFTGVQTEVSGLDVAKGAEPVGADAWSDSSGTETLDASGFGWGNSCPAPPQISIPGGGQLDWSLLCSMAAAFGALILAAAYVQAAFIIGRA